MFKNIMKALEEIRQQVNGLLQQREQDYEKSCAYMDAWMRPLSKSMEEKWKEMSEILTQLLEKSDATDGRIRFLEQQTDLLKKEIVQKLEETESKVHTESRYSFEASASLYNAMVQNMTELNERLTKQDFDRNATSDKDFGKILMKNKWHLIDKYYVEPDSFFCEICHTQIYRFNSDLFESKDIFHGGILKRYRCPGCGAIIGPLKMLEMTEEELGEEYRLHYSLYSEGDTTEAEIRTFQLLNPMKGKKYLNYGCGAWTETISRLRAEGYDVWGYDPYAPSASEYVYNCMEQMQDLQFDGLFSHDLLEHLRYPVKVFETFESLLKDGGRMAHATACYKYVYEYTRFHLFFYTGNSMEMICRQAGFQMIDQVEIESDLYFCNIFEKQIEVYR